MDDALTDWPGGYFEPAGWRDHRGLIQTVGKGYKVCGAGRDQTLLAPSHVQRAARGWKRRIKTINQIMPHTIQVIVGWSACHWRIF
jgi:hypothetical protein